MTPNENQPGEFGLVEYLVATLRQEFWIVLKAYFAPVFGTIAVLSHLREVIRLTDR